MPFSLARDLMESRRHVSPRRLIDPGPSDSQILAVLELASMAPDHGRLNPWRFVIVPKEQRFRLSQVFAQSLLERDPLATKEQLEEAAQKAHRAPVLLVAVARLGTREPNIDPLERMISMGAAVQNILLGAAALGYGSGLTSGKAMDSTAMRALLELEEGERAICCINLGTIGQHAMSRGLRPSPLDYVRVLQPEPKDV